MNPIDKFLIQETDNNLVLEKAVNEGETTFFAIHKSYQQSLIGKVYIYDVLEDLNQVLQQLFKFRQANLKGILLPLYYTKSRKRNFHILKLFTELQKSNLELVISNRRINNDRFSTAEIKDFVSQVFTILHNAQKNQLYHGNVKPNNILVSNELEYKIVEPYLTSCIEEELVYSAPQMTELIRFSRLKNLNRKVNVYAADVFSLGIILIIMTTMKYP